MTHGGARKNSGRDPAELSEQLADALLLRDLGAPEVLPAPFPIQL